MGFNPPLAVAALLTVAAVAPVHAQQKQLKWETNLASARKLAAKSGKPLLIDFYADWCGPCKLMDEETFSTAGVRALMQKAVCVRLDLDKNEKAALEFEVQSIPRVIMLPSGGGRPLMDLLGYQDADEFTTEMRRALGMKANEVVLPMTESAAMTRVREALQSKSFDALRQSEPKIASAGLNDLVGALGVNKESELAPLVELLKGAGGEAVPALIRGMNHRHLAVRAGSYRALQSVLRERKAGDVPAYDPWSAPSARQAQVQRWTAWWQTRKGR